VKHAGEPIEVTDEHPLWAIRGVPPEYGESRTLECLTKGKLKAEWVDAGQLEPRDFVGFAIPSEVVPVAGITEDDARLYGILLSGGELSKNGFDWCVSGNPERDTHLQFVRDYLWDRGVHFWETGRGQTYVQLHWVCE